MASAQLPASPLPPPFLPQPTAASAITKTIEIVFMRASLAQNKTARTYAGRSLPSKKKARARRAFRQLSETGLPAARRFAALHDGVSAGLARGGEVRLRLGREVR